MFCLDLNSCVANEYTLLNKQLPPPCPPAISFDPFGSDRPRDWKRQLQDGEALADTVFPAFLAFRILSSIHRFRAGKSI
jgi:hypothetical protein